MTHNSALDSRVSWYTALVLAALACVALALVRFYPLLWNIASIGALALFCGARLRHGAAVLLPLGLMLVTDYWLSVVKPENRFPHEETPWVYGTYAVLFLLGNLLGRTENPWRLTALSLGGSLIFFLVTNFGSWANVAVLHTVQPWPGVDDYSADIGGLLRCYANGLEFYRGTAIGDVVSSIVLFGSHALVIRLVAEPATETVA